jgi:hypothetical protein
LYLTNPKHVKKLQIERPKREITRPTPAEMGLEMTIAIVALTAPHEHFICVSDQMISFDDVTQADEAGLIKTVSMSLNWSAAFSANKIENILPLLNRVRSKINEPNQPLDIEDLKEYFTASVTEMIQEDFFRTHIARYGYKNLEHFRRDGRADLGDSFAGLYQKLNEYDLGAEFIVYGYSGGFRIPSLFEVSGKGQIIDRMALRYAVIGSGYWMATASLRRKPLPIDFDSMLYRLLEAKFSAETASGVGRRTTVTIKGRDLHDLLMSFRDVDKMRNIWESTLQQPAPEGALEIAGKIREIMAGSENDRRRLLTR